MPYVTNDDIREGYSESIVGYRSTGANGGQKTLNTCDKRVTAYDPFDYSVTYRWKTVKVKVYYIYNRRRYFRYDRKKVLYPFYTFKKKTRTVKQWRLELSSGKKVLDVTIPLPAIQRTLSYIEAKLSKEGPCRPRLPKSAHIQNSCFHWKSTISGYPGDVNLAVPYWTGTQPLVSNKTYGYRAFELNHEVHTGTQGTGDNLAFSNLMQKTMYDDPVTNLGSAGVVELLTAMLWPSSDDYVNRNASPLVDLAEAASDGVFPLGPPPSASEAHKRMSESALDGKYLKSLTETIDFAANSWLWTTLVLEPVIGAAVGLAASVQSNDDAIEAYQKAVKKGSWFQGKSLRLYGKDANQAALCHGAPLERSESIGVNACQYITYGTLEHILDYKKFTANAMMVYKPSFSAAANMNTSGQRLSSFFNRLSTDLENVLYNVASLSFVVDWFTRSYSGKLNLEDKVFMPISDWKLITSFSADVEMRSTINQVTWGTHVVTLYEQSRYPCTHPWHLKYPLKEYRRSNYYYGWACFETGVRSDCITNLPIYGKYGYISYESNTIKEYEYKYEYQENHSAYIRSVYDRPNKATTYDMTVFDCFDTQNYDELSTGQEITLGALIWGAGSRFLD